MKISIIIPVYYNQDNLLPLYEDLKSNIINVIDYKYELVLVNDGSKDNSYTVMQELAEQDKNIKIINLSRNFGSHAACLCGLINSTGDCAVIKAADQQEPSDMILDMVNSWKKGNNVVLAVRNGRQDKKSQTLFANFYYWMVRKTSLSTMPKTGFDIYLLDRKVINVLKMLDEKNSVLTGQILWSGFKTDIVYYTRLERKIGKSKWTLKKKIKMFTDTLFGFSTLPIKIVTVIGTLSFLGSLIWSIFELVAKLKGKIEVKGWTTLFIFNLFSFSIIMLTLGILGEYLWRTFDSSRKRPTYIIEESNISDTISS